MEASKRKKMSIKKTEERKVKKKSSITKKRNSGLGDFTFSSICLILITLTAAAMYHVYTTMFNIPELPAVALHTWWGPNNTRESQDTSIRPYRVVFTDAMQEQLGKKFEDHRSLPRPDSFDGTAWTYGVHSKALAQIFRHWQFQYPFKARQRFFNQYQHYLTNVQGLDIHFVRVKPDVENAKVLPIILLHGWPSSFREFYDVIPLLTSQRAGYDFVFEVILPSLPGFGFSEFAIRPGLGPYQTAVIMRNLMQRLGFTQYYIQGGDFGHFIGSIMATLFPKEILGFHSNMPLAFSKPTILSTVLGDIWPTLVEPKHWQKIYPVKRNIEFQIEEYGYSHLQATKPDTIGIALNESPLGLAAYMLDKFMVYTDASNKLLEDGGLTKYYNMTDLIDNVMVYWVSGSITTSMRIYKEFVNSGVESTLEMIPTPVQTWFLYLKYELFIVPEVFLRWKYPNLRGTTTHDFGGHFAAMERPKELADDVFLAVKSFRIEVPAE